MSAPAPLRSGDYDHPVQRRTLASSSPFDPDWLLQRSLSRDIGRALSTHARGRLLDVGCGGRPYQARMPAEVSYVGVDAPGGADTRPDAWAHAGALPIADASFDTILCTQVLEHVADPAKVLAEVARVLRPGGKLLLTAPQAWFLHEEPYDFYRYTRFGLAHLCAAAGLRMVEVRAQGGFWSMAGIFFAVHLGSYVRWAAERRPASRVAARSVPGWRKLLWPARFPMALANVIFAVLDAIPQPGMFAVNHLVVAAKPGGEVSS